MANKPYSILNEIDKGAIFLALLLLVCHGLSLFASYFWIFDVLRSFALQYIIGALVFGLYFALRKNKAWTITMTLTALYITGVSLSPPQVDSIDTTAKNFKIILFNKLMYYPNQKDIITMLEQENPDMLVLQEPDPESLTFLGALDDYPHVLHKIEKSPFGMMVISKHPFEKASLESYNENGLHNWYSNIEILINEQPVSIYSFHPFPPVSAHAIKRRNNETAHIAKVIANDSNKNILLVGDLNNTPYSPYFKDLLKHAGLKNHYTSWIPTPTWSTAFFDTICQIPIDHILHKGDLRLIEKRRGSNLGSDHYPLIAVYELDKDYGSMQ